LDEKILNKNKRKPIILMIEQDEEDSALTKSVFDEKQYEVEIHILSQADEALAWLDFSSSRYIQPSVILININLIPSGGIELCRTLKNGKYHFIPVIILSDSSQPALVKQSYEAGANSFIQKPTLSDPTYQVIDQFMKYWFDTVSLPDQKT